MMPEMPQYPELPRTLELGQFYMRPCLRTTWIDEQVRWIPVIGTIHNDREYIRADFEHVHVDYRFLNRRVRQILARDDEANGEGCISDIFKYPVSSVMPEGESRRYNLDSRELEEFSPKSWIRVMRRKYQGPYQQYPHDGVPWRGELGAAFTHRHLIGGTTCPHQGTDLSGIEPDPDGFITCPLHGLRWCPYTGVNAVVQQSNLRRRASMLLHEVRDDQKVRREVAERIETQGSQQYHLQLASNILALEEADDQGGLDQLWELYGKRDCLNALIYVNDHYESRPAPTVTIGAPELLTIGHD